MTRLESLWKTGWRNATRYRAMSMGAAICLLAPNAEAQDQPASRLPLGIVSGVQLSGISSVRELSDGSVLVSDAIDQRLLLLRFDSDEAVDVAREGSGPSEFRSVSDLFELPADTTIMSDVANGRWMVLVGDSVVGSMSIEEPAVGFARSTIRGFDTLGHVLTLKRISRVPLSDGLSADSVAVVRILRSTGLPDTITGMISNPAALPSGGGRNPMLSRAFGVAMTAPEQAILFRDGWIAVARLKPYRVDWIAPDGGETKGSPLPHTPVRVDDREKQAYARRVSQGSGRRISISRTRWPEFIGAFGRDALFASADGRLVIRRQRTADNDAFVFDIVDRSGRLAGRFEIPGTSRVVGFGARAVYLAVLGSDGLGRLSKHAWPSGQ